MLAHKFMKGIIHHATSAQILYSHMLIHMQVHYRQKLAAQFSHGLYLSFNKNLVVEGKDTDGMSQRRIILLYYYIIDYFLSF